ncbi:hypothetical protein [Lacticaseibacillus paracasei]|uniref:hypothetical protein n=1 Tax=Lacticaseibacillus paracasei TaxID=1597 RepID=UPI00073B74EB|nr:hypothetical protein [Lacticaseibacillus paracasei]KTE98756.1 hypothetical protein AC564_1530 [Lacticaseibacillus paracasei]TXJ64682.1 hypothetical protein FGO89_10610 [Lacticaseibacillus paracasei]
MNEKTKATADNGAVANTGNNAAIASGDNAAIMVNHFNASDGLPRRSVIFDVCQSISGANIEYEQEYSLDRNPDWQEKLQFNNVSEFGMIFTQYASGYDRVEEILVNFEHREALIRKINTVYIRLRASASQNELPNGDLMLSRVFDKLKLLMNQLNDQVTSPLEDEEIDGAIYLLMFYAFTKCKLLQPPRK